MAFSVNENNSRDYYIEQQEIRRIEAEKRAEEERKAEERRKEADASIFAKDDYNFSAFAAEENIFGGFFTDNETENNISVIYGEAEIADETETVEKGEDKNDVAETEVLSTNGSTRSNGSGRDLDGNIDASAQSGYTGDCWLLTGLNSLSYSEAGREAIREAMTFNDDGSVTINFKGLGVSYTVSAEQIKAANQNRKYSSGDDDVLVYEMAIEQLRNDIGSGKIKFDVDSPYYVSDTSTGRSGNSSIDGGFVEQVWYLLTGKLSETTSDPAEVQQYLDKFAQNPDSSAMSCSFKGGQGDRNGFTVTDANGNKVQLYYSHAYAVKSVDGNNVTIVNPWDSSEEIVLDRDTFAQYANLSYSDLSNASKDMSGAFSKIVGYISGLVENIGNTIKDFFGIGHNYSNHEVPIGDEENIFDENMGQANASGSAARLSGLIITLVEQYKNGDISKSELLQYIQSFNIDTPIAQLRMQYNF
ncbi:hypothetical protein IKQ26_08550 [bacterium]|nr:hypothetical protein [bacterium]